MAAPPAATPRRPIINEFVLDHRGDDTREFVEILATPNTDYSNLAVIALEGDKEQRVSGGKTYNAGCIEAILRVGHTNAAGYWAPFQERLFPNGGTQTLLLVRDLAASAKVADDLDVDDDGVIDANPPFAEILDAVAVFDSEGVNVSYAGAASLPALKVFPYRIGGASRIPNGVDTDTAADWKVNDWEGDGLGLRANVAPARVDEAVNTPGLPNRMGTRPIR
jgi:hypothetical protein